MKKLTYSLAVSRYILNIGLFAACLTASTAYAEKFTIQSDSFKDGQKIPVLYAGTEQQCGSGSGVSPHVRWSHLPTGTASLAIFLTDPDGQKGTGTSHWVVYNIPATTNQVNEGLKGQTQDSFTVGVNTMGQTAYRGLCAQPQENPHHYTLTVVATTIPPGDLPPGLNREALLEKLKGRSLLGQSIVGLYR
ncbi:YbhB/YbcL family Raf kinase inhibitor-like protein [Pseudomonas putida]|uniref:YbhB/YbcL family Raf kinase inhibitor-like protein n=1 Tax=Pseudomonas TaxID=286 RepID=UPI000BA33292|nr:MULTISPECIES: YbhB/YbcL family Raf kinase inhibitor-like protein [Pseudomonas]EKT4448932.1 YbhB/YbcL family Raf kinase inhibitor-like protein [Pseudomonas putida]MDD2068109.1 YbhB/YbcL family Raf kinase inhibitor-like protein [Pseudomonas putida]HDS1740427.1 YbhB/YbcL family Raf kinase inhibitor-like protein [Pseudomonas putida]